MWSKLYKSLETVLIDGLYTYTSRNTLLRCTVDTSAPVKKLSKKKNLKRSQYNGLPQRFLLSSCHSFITVTYLRTPQTMLGILWTVRKTERGPTSYSTITVYYL